MTQEPDLLWLFEYFITENLAESNDLTELNFHDELPYQLQQSLTSLSLQDSTENVLRLNCKPSNIKDYIGLNKKDDKSDYNLFQEQILHQLQQSWYTENDSEWKQIFPQRPEACMISVA